ncbi:MAG: potassium-transporting ATPase subunit KdpA [Bacteroidales bacterium]
MKSIDFFQILLYLIILVALTPLLGSYMYKVFTGKRHLLVPLLGGIEKYLYRLAGVDSQQEENWKSYTWSLLLFNLAGLIFVFLLQMFQSVLPLNPEHLVNPTWHSALNTAVSFVTNTNWQGYSGETTLSYLVQMLGLTVQNFVSAATGIAVLLALVRGLTRKTSESIGNFWIDLVRSTLYLLLPLSLLLSVVLVGEGVIQNFHAYQEATTMEGAQQVLPMGPAASQIAIKQLGTNGGGFFNTNSAHPFENPTPLSNFLEMLAILLIPAALTYTFGKMTGSLKEGWILFFSMMILLIAGLVISLFSEFSTNHLPGATSLMEGKETRFGVSNSVLWSVCTTAASNGSVNAMHDSLSPLSGMIALLNIMLGEVIFGGVGAGLYGMLVFVFLTVFIAGLMVGRTPEYLGKKIDAFDIKMTIIAILAPGLVILLFSALAAVIPQGLAGLNNSGPHGLSEILYAFSSAGGNNGSAFAGLNANTVFYNITLAFGMLIGRFGIIIPVLAIAGNMAGKKVSPPSPGTFRTDSLLFVILLISVILIIGGLTFLPALSLGPVAEQLLQNSAYSF